MVRTFDNDFAPQNVYGHALSLLEGLCAPGDSVHLDIGCGFGRMAEPLVQRLRRHYVGVDMDPDGLRSLSSRGFETHQLTLGPSEANLTALRAILRGRQLGSLSMLDTLEHLRDPLAALLAVRNLIGEHNVPVVVSVPNVAHRDVGMKLLAGRFDYTEAGLLDHTHLGLFTEMRLTELARNAGLHQLSARDVHLQSSDQRFPPDHLALADGALLHQFLRNVRDGADCVGSVNQFVRAFAAGEAHPSLGYASRQMPAGPFLSVVTRTQGRRLDALRDVLTTLMGQSSTDFEVLVLGHRLDAERQLLVERSIADCPAWLRERIRLVLVNHGSRTVPLNVGFAEARGRYVSILDDDDLVFGHWVETFEKLAAQKPGAILRARCVRQYSEIVHLSGHDVARTVTGFERLWPGDFDLAAHLSMNFSPGLSLAFPRSVFSDFGLRFDESLTTNEDWDFLLRALPLCSVTNSPEITSIYRWWTNRDASQQEHPKDEWDTNRAWVLKRIDSQPFLLPSGGTRRIRELYEQNLTLMHQDQESRRKNDELRHALAQGTQQELEHLQAHMAAMYRSSSWRYTRPLRALGRVFGRAPAEERSPEHLTASELKRRIEEIRISTSWRLMGPLRVIVRRIRSRRR